MKELWDYIHHLFQEHRAIRNALVQEGKTYRSHTVAFQNGYCTALHDIQDYLRKPEREADLRKEMAKLAEMFKAQK